MLTNKLLKDDIVCVDMQLSKDIAESLEFLVPISDSYPCIDKWFLNKVVPGLSNGTRKLFIYRRSGNVVALCIAKKTEVESKICTVRVAPEYTGKGLGVKLFREAMAWLKTEMPHLTVSQERLPDFERVFEYFGYKLTSTVKGLYFPDSVEYLFNEPLTFKSKNLNTLPTK